MFLVCYIKWKSLLILKNLEADEFELRFSSGQRGFNHLDWTFGRHLGLVIRSLFQRILLLPHC